MDPSYFTQVGKVLVPTLLADFGIQITGWSISAFLQTEKVCHTRLPPEMLWQTGVQFYFSVSMCSRASRQQIDIPYQIDQWSPRLVFDDQIAGYFSSLDLQIFEEQVAAATRGLPIGCVFTTPGHMQWSMTGGSYCPWVFIWGRLGFAFLVSLVEGMFQRVEQVGGSVIFLLQPNVLNGGRKKADSFEMNVCLHGSMSMSRREKE